MSSVLLKESKEENVVKFATHETYKTVVDPNILSLNISSHRVMLNLSYVLVLQGKIKTLKAILFTSAIVSGLSAR